MFEINLVIYRPYLDVFLEIYGLLDQKQKLKLIQNWLL